MTERIPSPWRPTAALAWHDLMHEWRITACQVLALAAVLAPLLVLFGLKSGIVSTMTARLLDDPLNLEVTIVGSQHLEPAWFARLRARPDTGFVIERSRSLAATLDLTTPGHAAAAVEMVPTAPGDPLLGKILAPPATATQVLLSKSLAQALSVGAGGQVTAIISRRMGGEQQAARLTLAVTGVLPEAAFGRDGIFVAPALMVASEDYRDGKDLPALAGPDTFGPRAFASARVFARGIDAVAPLAAALRADGLEVRTRAAEIETVKAVDRVLSFIFGVIAGIAVGGYLLSLAASLWANVDRKRKDLALMRLVGFPARAVMAFPAIQALVVAAAGIALSLAAYGVVAALFNSVLSGNLAKEEFVCRLLPWHAAAAAALTMLAALAASAIGGYRASKIDPVESLRDL